MLRIGALVCTLLLCASPVWAQSSPTTINVANAPAYSNSATMTQGNAGTSTPASRVLAGPGYTVGGGFTNGSKVCLFQALNSGTTAGSGSASALQTACSSGTPANTGGIYATSFPGATTATDGSVTFALLTVIDNQTLSEAYNDTTASWSTATNYYPGQKVRNQGVIYRNVTPSLGSPYYCTSAGSMPSPPGFGGTITDGGSCVWEEDVSSPQYSSQTNVWQGQIYNTCAYGACGATAQFSAPITVVRWHGGHERTAYVPGQNNEDVPILEWNHYDFYNDHQPVCTGCAITLTVAPGDSFVDNVSPTTGVLGGANGNLGVLIQGIVQWPLGGPQGTFQSGGEGEAFSDAGVNVLRAQEQSLYGNACSMSHGLGPGNQHTDGIYFQQTILDNGGGWGNCKDDAGTTFDTDLIIDRSLLPGTYGVLDSYAINVYDSTILGNNASDSFGVGSEGNVGSDQSYYYNNLVFGFTYPYAGTGSSLVGGSGHNGTDVASGSLGQTVNPANGDGALTAAQLPGTTINSMVPANELVQPLVQSPVQVTTSGAGANYGVTSQSASFTSAAPNSTVVCGVGTSGATITSFTAAGLTWTLRGGNSSIQVYAAPIVTPGSYMATANFATSAGLGQVACIVAAGTPASSFYDPNGSLPSTAGTTSPSITTTQANDLLVTFFICSNQIFSNNVTAGWQGGNTIQMVYQWRNVNAAQTGLAPTVSGSCTSVAAYGDALIENPVSGSALNALVKSASAQGYGAGTMTLTGLITAPGPDILGQSRSSRVDLGAVNFTPGSGPTLPTNSGRRFH